MMTPADKAEHFLDCGIKNEISKIQKLVLVMEGYVDDNVQKLAKRIKDTITSKIKQGMYMYITYVHVRKCDHYNATNNTNVLW